MLKLNVTQIGMVLVLVPAALAIVFGSVLAIILFSQEKTLDSLSHSRDAIIALQKTETTLQRALGRVCCARDFTDETKKDIDDIYLQFSSPRKKIGFVEYSDFPELKQLAEKRAEETRFFRKVIRKMKELSDNPLQSNEEKFISFRDAINENRSILLQACLDSGQWVKDVVYVESKVRAAQPIELEKFHTLLACVLIAGIIISVIISIVLVKVFTNQILQKLNYAHSRALRLAAGQTLDKPEHGDDEFSNLDRVFYESSLVLRDARRKELAVLDNVADIVCSLDARMRIEMVSLAVEKQWKYKTEDLFGMSMLSLLTSDTVNDTREAFEKVARTGQEDVVENVVRCRDGSLKNFLWTTTWSLEQSKFFCVVHDVTELRAMQNLKQHFVAMVSHDLRTPLMSLSTSLQLIEHGKKGDVSAEVLREVGRCKTSTARLVELVNDLLELERFEAGRLSLDIDLVSAQHICSTAQESLQAMADEAKIEIVGPKNDLAIMADEQRMIQVVINLLSNAIKFSPAGSQVNLSISRYDDFAEIRIADHGPGIPAGERDFVFQKFSQTAIGERHPGQKGSGLGLAIVKEIVEAHSGHCGVISTLSEGSIFWIRIPAPADQAEDVDT